MDNLSAPLLYEVASHVKQLPFRPLLLLLLLSRRDESPVLYDSGVLTY